MEQEHCIHPGEIWLDDEGKRIEAHAGSIFYEGGIFYWYGENKEETDGLSKVWTKGVRYYSSKDLYSWHDEGYLLPPSEDPESPLNPTTHCLDRPHIIFHKKTGRYLCYVKLLHRTDDQSCIAVFSAPSFRGPYRLEKDYLHPFGFNVGDFDLAEDDNGDVYLYFEKVHTSLIACKLSEDGFGFEEGYKEYFQAPYPPFVREAPAHFERNGKHYLFTSGTTAHRPSLEGLFLYDDHEAQ